MSVAKSKFAATLRVSSGNFLEMYDFQVYAYFATYIAKAFFPSSNEFVSLMATLATFGAGYLMRPLGALVLGAYVDRHGRRKGLILSLGLMSVGTAVIALTPAYAAIGVAAPLIVVAGRLLQGFSAGVELGGVSVYLSEIAPPGRRGFYCSWQSASQQVAVILAASLGVVLVRTLAPPDMQTWGWRTPFLVGCLIVPFLLVLRRSLEETEAFRAQTHPPSVGELAGSMLKNWRVVLIGMMMVIMTTTTFYLITAYTPTFVQKVLKLTAEQSLLVTLCVGVSNFIWLPIGGTVSDRIGRRPLLFFCTLATLVSAYPLMVWLVGAPSMPRLLTVELWLSAMFGIYNGAMIPFLTEIIPFRIRTIGFSFAFSVATAVFGGFTPAICTYLIHVTGNQAMPGVWVSLAAGCGLIAAFATAGKATNAHRASAHPDLQPQSGAPA